MKPKKNLVELVLTSETEDKAGIDAIAFVDQPAIEVNFHYFKEEKFVSPNKGEKEKDYISRCIKKLFDDKTTDDNEQAAAICYSNWNKYKMGSEVITPAYVDEVPKKKTIEPELRKALVKMVNILGNNQDHIFNNIDNKRTFSDEDNAGWTYHIGYKFMKKIFDMDEVHTMHQVLSAYMQENEDIFSFYGSSPWIQIKYMKSPEGKFRILSQTRIKNVKSEESPMNKSQFKFINEEQRLVVSPIMIPDKVIGRIDKETGLGYECFFTRKTIEQLAEKYMSELKLNNSNIMHNENEPTKITLVESWFVCEDPTKDKSTYYGFNVPAGTWMGIMRVKDDTTWNNIKNGTLKGLSIEGNFGEKIIN